MILNGSGAVSNSNLYDSFGVLRYAVSGSAVTQWRWLGAFQEEEGLVAGAGGTGDTLAARGLRAQSGVRRRRSLLFIGRCSAGDWVKCNIYCLTFHASRARFCFVIWLPFVGWKEVCICGK